MNSTLLYSLTAILVITIVTVLLRALPFLIFANRPLPKAIQYLGQVLPPAIMTILVVYCLKGINLTAYPFGIAEIAASLLVVLLQCIKKNMYISIVAGTICYMVLLRLF